MLSLSDWREDIRVLQLNKPSLRPLFILLRILKWSLYLLGAVLLIAFCWALTSPQSPLLSHSSSLSRSSSLSQTDIEASTNKSAHAVLSVDSQRSEDPSIAYAANDGEANGEISSERIEYLRSFAVRARAQTASELNAEKAGDTTTGGSPVEPPITAAVQSVDDDVAVYAVTERQQLESMAIADPEAEKKRVPTSGQMTDRAVAAKASDKTEGRAAGRSTGLDNASAADTLASEAAIQVVGISANPNLDGALAALKTATARSVDSGVTPVAPQNSEGAGISSESPVKGAPTQPQKKPTDNTGPSDKAYQTQEWVLAQKGNHYTIQIGATVNRPFLLKFINRLPNDRTVALFRHRVNRANKEEYVLSYGSFASYRAASAALESLSEPSRRYGAYIRAFGSIQEQVRQLEPDSTRFAVVESTVGKSSDQE